MIRSSQHRNWSLPRVALLLFVLLSCLRAWLGPMSFMDPVQAQIPDAGTQRKELVDEVRRTNQLLQEIKQILSSDILNVRIQGADNTSTDNKAG